LRKARRRSDILLPSRKPYFPMAFSRPLLSARGDGMMFVRQSVMRIRLRQDNFHFRHRNHRQVADEKQEEREKDPEGADKRPDIDPGRDEEPPRRREKVAMQSADDDD